jgi:hypothetical protein
MERITIQKLSQLLKQDGTMERFHEKLKEHALIFPAQCSGSIKYKFAFNLPKVKKNVICDVLLEFDCDDRNYSVTDVKIISTDQFIRMSYAGDREFRQAYNNMIQFINKKRS